MITLPLDQITIHPTMSILLMIIRLQDSASQSIGGVNAFVTVFLLSRQKVHLFDKGQYNLRPLVDL